MLKTIVDFEINVCSNGSLLRLGSVGSREYLRFTKKTANVKHIKRTKAKTKIYFCEVFKAYFNVSSDKLN